MKRPTDSAVITLPYGSTSAPYSRTNPHAGTDYRAPTGSNIYAPHGGKITHSGSLGDCGLAIDIDGGRFKSRLCHNSKLLKLVGNQVNEGDVVALSGATGAAVGAHCHWVLWDNGNRVDGSKYVTIGGNMSSLVNGDIDNLLKDFGITPTQADYDAAKLSDKELHYYLQKRYKHVLSDGDVNNLFRDAGIEPIEADYQSVRKLNPKDFIYYLQGRLKNALSTKGFSKVGNISSIGDVYKKD